MRQREFDLDLRRCGRFGVDPVPGVGAETGSPGFSKKTMERKPN